MLVVGHERSEHGPQRRKADDGRLLHCCCICGTLEPWGNNWTSYHSIKELDDGAPIPKFCSDPCRARGGVDASDVTDEMKRKAKDSEWREPTVAYREATSREKYNEAAHQQRSKKQRADADRACNK